MNFLNYNKEFLKQLDNQQNKTIYARIIALDFNEFPLQQIEGYISQGSINVDGNSSVRRSCSLTIVSREENFKISDLYYYWGLHTKFKLEIGIENTVDKSYPNVIWFPQGIFIITSFNISRTTNNFTISLQAKDKMCLLNGEVGGNLESGIDFGQIDEVDKNGQIITRKLTLVDIIKNLLKHYAQEKEENIVINDLDQYGLELLEYRGESPLYLFRQGNETIDSFLGATYHGDILCKLKNEDKIIALKDIENTEFNLYYDKISNDLLKDSSSIAKIEEFGNNKIPEGCSIVKINYGQVAGYKITDLVFPGNSEANIGETLTSILDKIKNMLGEFEYFYDVNGRFIFQKKPSSYNKIFNSDYLDQGKSAKSIVEQERKFLEKLEQSKSNTYNFNGTQLITTFNPTPNIGNIKNDFIIWGQNESISGQNIAIHLRCAIDNKPKSYRTIEVTKDMVKEYNEKYNTKLLPQTSMYFVAGDEANIIYNNSHNQIEVICDWREIIFRMANDYFKYGFLKNFNELVYEANGIYDFGVTKYESYYTDIQGHWRKLYNPNYLTYNSKTLYQLMHEEERGEELIYEETNEGILYPQKNYYSNSNSGLLKCWNKSITEAPETIDFWFDFIDVSGELNNYNVNFIGRRQKVINDTNIKAIEFYGAPTVIYVNNIQNHKTISSGDYSYLQCPEKIELFSISAQGQSAMDKLNQLLYQHTYCTETINITTLPIYYLQPNTRIHIEDSSLGISGDYIVTKISIQLSHNGTMNITSEKAFDQIDYY